jgi:hypothetical protein
MMMLYMCLPAVPVIADDAETGSRYVKLDFQATELPAAAEEWAMVKDTATGLIWENKTMDGSIHDVEKTYDWQEAHDIFLAELNGNKFGGFSDWRIPTTDELREIIVKGEEPYVDQQFFPHTAPTGYLSWRECGSGEIFPERVIFGREKNWNKNRRVMAVRGDVAP